MSLNKNTTYANKIARIQHRTVYCGFLANPPNVTQEFSTTISRTLGSLDGPCEEEAVSPSPPLPPLPPPIITAGLLIHFDANNSASYAGTGTTWTNIGSGGSAYDATFLGIQQMPVFSPGAINSFQFTQSFLGNGSDYLQYNCMSFPRPPAISDDFTWCAWINTTDVGYGANHYNFMFIVSTETGGLNDDFGFGIDANGKLAYGDGSSSPGGSDISISSTQSVNTGTWTFVAVTRRKATGEIVLYINGLPDTTGICNVGNTLSTATDVLIGAETDFPGYTFGGNLGAILGNTSVLTDAQILQNFNAQRSIYGV
jgi:hypothetical protein